MTKKHDELVEEIAALEHGQWIEWSKAVAPEVSQERRERWEKYWVPYEQLSEEAKEQDRIWARKVIARVVKGPLPGEVGRGRLHAHGIYEDVDWDDGRHGKVRNEDHRFIALRTGETGEGND